MQEFRIEDPPPKKRFYANHSFLEKLALYKHLNLDLAGEEENDIESSVIKNHGEKVFCVLRSLYKILSL